MFELALHQHNKGYDSENIYDLPPMLKRTAHIHMVTSTNKGPIDPLGSQGGVMSISPSTPTGRTSSTLFHRLAQKFLNIDEMPLTLMECYDEDKDE